MHSTHPTADYRLLVWAVILLLALPAAADDVEKGQDLYASRCMFCHGASGKGDGPAAAALKPPPTDFTTVAYWKAADTARMKGIIVSGIPGTGMLAFKATLTPEQIDDLVAYLAAFKPAP